MIETYFSIQVACYLIVALIVLALIIVGIAIVLIDRFKK